MGSCNTIYVLTSTDKTHANKGVKLVDLEIKLVSFENLCSFWAVF